MSTTRFCPTCGAEASPSERFCANCGSRLPEAPPQPPADTIRLPESTPPTPAPTDTPPPSDGGLRLPGSASMGGGEFPGATPVQPRKGLPIWAIILLAIGGLCAIGCVATFAITTIVGQRVVEEAATAVIQEATAQAEVLPTRPPLSSGDPEATPTPSVILALPTGGPLGGTREEDVFAEASEAFRDEFEDNRNSWFTGEVSDIEVDSIEDGVFKVVWSGKGTTYETYQERTFTNFIAELDCRVEAGGTDGACAIVFGETSEVGLYKFEVYPDYYALYIVPSEDSTPPLLEGDPSELINAGDWNRLRIVRQGDEIRAYLNDKLLGTASDSTFTEGYVGPATSSFAEDGGVEVWFDNFTIWELP